MRSPTVKSLMERFGLTFQSAKVLKQFMRDGKVEQALELANDLLEGYGVESLYPDFEKFQYVNMGETYALTLCFTGQSFYIGSWGDWVELHSKLS